MEHTVDPIMFLLSSMVSGIALIIVIYVLAMKTRRKPIDMNVLYTLASFLLFIYVLDVSVELLELGAHDVYARGRN